MGGKVDYCDPVTSLEVILVMAGFPLAIMVLLTLRPRFAWARRSRPGEEWNYPPVLFTANPEALPGGSANHQVTGEARGGDRGGW